MQVSTAAAIVCLKIKKSARPQQIGLYALWQCLICIHSLQKMISISSDRAIQSMFCKLVSFYKSWLKFQMLHHVVVQKFSAVTVITPVKFVKNLMVTLDSSIAQLATLRVQSAPFNGDSKTVAACTLLF